jgi:hypothetical protein
METGNGNNVPTAEKVLKEWEKYELSDQMLDILLDHVGKVRDRGTITDTKAFLEGWAPIVSGFKARLLESFLLTAAEVRGKQRISRLQRREYLKALVTPLVKYSQLQPVDQPFVHPDGTYPFVNEKIRVREEISVRQFIYDRNRYTFNERRIRNECLDPDEPCIELMEERQRWIEELKSRPHREFVTLGPFPYENSLRDLYQGWIGKLTMEVMKSRDLLDQLLVIFTIKRALNGEERAIKKLYDLYADTATAIAYKMARRYNIFDCWDDIKQDAQFLLRFILTGFNPRTVLEALTNPDSRRLLPLPLWVEKFSLYYFSQFLPDELAKLMQDANEGSAGLQIMALLYPSSFFNDDARWRGTPKRVMRLNNLCFRPKKDANLTIWLFGNRSTPDGYMTGRFCQLLRDRLRETYLGTKPERNAVEFDESSYVEDNGKEALQDEVSVEQTRDKLKDGGFAKRDIDIFCGAVFDETPKVRLAKQHGLSRTQIYRIINEIKAYLKEALFS